MVIDPDHSSKDSTPYYPNSRFQVGMELLLDGESVTVEEVLKPTAMSDLCKVRAIVNGNTSLAVLKVLNATTARSDTERERFTLECLNTEYIGVQFERHNPHLRKHVPQVYASFQKCEIPGGKNAGRGLLMRCIQGVSIGDLAREQSDDEFGLNFKRTLPLALELAETIAAMHAHNIVHRDMKPDNVLVEEGEARVIDFGIATRVGECIPGQQDNNIIGSLGFIPPEYVWGNVSGHESSPRHDLFGLGALLYSVHYRGGKFGYIGGNRGFLQYTQDIGSWELHGLPIPTEREKSPLTPIVRKLTARQDKTYTTAAEVLRDLKALQNSQGISLPQESPGLFAQVRRWFMSRGRNRSNIVG